MKQASTLQWRSTGRVIQRGTTMSDRPDWADDYDFDNEPEDDEFGFDCAGYYPEPAGEFYCPLWGTEECDWECPHGGIG